MDHPIEGRRHRNVLARAVLALEQRVVHLQERGVDEHGTDLLLHPDQAGQPHIHGRRHPGAPAGDQVVAHARTHEQPAELRIRHRTAKQRRLRLARHLQMPVHVRVQA